MKLILSSAVKTSIKNTHLVLFVSFPGYSSNMSKFNPVFFTNSATSLKGAKHRAKKILAIFYSNCRAGLLKLLKPVYLTKEGTCPLKGHFLKTVEKLAQEPK